MGIPSSWARSPPRSAADAGEERRGSATAHGRANGAAAGPLRQPYFGREFLWHRRQLHTTYCAVHHPLGRQAALDQPGRRRRLYYGTLAAGARAGGEVRGSCADRWRQRCVEYFNDLDASAMKREPQRCPLAAMTSIALDPDLQIESPNLSSSLTGSAATGSARGLR